MSIYRRILRYIKPYKFLLILSLTASLVFVALNSASVWMVGSLMSKIVAPGTQSAAEQLLNQTETTSLNDKLKTITEWTVGSGNQADQLLRLCIILLVVFILKNVFFYINKVSLEYVQNRMITDIREHLFRHIHSLPLSFFDKNKSAELQAILIRDVNVLRTAFTQSFQKLIVEPFNILAFMILLLIISWKMTLVILLTVPLSGYFIVKLGQSIRRKARRSSKQIAGVMNVMQESLQGMRIVKAFSMEKFEINRFVVENNRFFKLIFRQASFRSLSSPVNEIIGVTIGVVLLWYGGLEVLSGKGLSSDDFMRFILLLFAMMQPARQLGNVNAHIQAGLASADRVFSVLDTSNTISEIDNPEIITEFQSGVEFRNVSFQYENSDSKSLNDVSVTIHKGEIIALVGLSGAGKSTFVDLIPRFYDVTAGSVLIDGHNVKNLTLNSLRSLMGIVTQETILFNDSIRKNIAYGLPEVTLEDIKSAATAAHAHEFISKLTNGYDTMVGEKGSRLSGGERQRISIARAILKNPEILILDEATSALDSEAEQKVQQAIDSLVKNRTVIVIAHRLSTIMKSDKIIVLDNGCLIEMGSHEELLELGGKYRQLYNIQFKNVQ
ncbi:MAG: ABC transporter ATP-binding protein [FCB group bacterium]|nr:ABC transporter ATP-binding protein [FCB group bacterium]